MVQPASKRIITEEALTTKLTTDFNNKIAKSKLRALGDQFCGVKYGTKVQASKAIVSMTQGAVVDGFVAGGSFNYKADAMYDIADVNWSALTLSAYGTSHTNQSKSNGVGTTFDFTTIFEGSYMIIGAFKFNGSLMDFRLWIDDEEVTDWYNGTRAAGVLKTNQPEISMGALADHVNAFLNINFPKHGMYKIRCSGITITGTGSLISCNAEGKFHKPEKQRKVGIISDSWFDTVPAGTSLNNATEMCARMGWSPWNMSVGGSGFMNPSGAGGGPHQYGSDAVFAALAKAPDLDLLIVNGSANDMAYSEASVIAAMQAFFTRFKGVRPDTPIVWGGVEPVSFFEATYTAAAMVTRENNLAAIALAEPNVIGVIRPSLENWITGTGNITAPNGTGNQDFLTCSDGTHMGPFGTYFSGALWHARLKSMPTWKGAMV